VTLDPANSLTGGQGRFGGNIGAGFIGYAGNVGVRGDVRWYNVDVERGLQREQREGRVHAGASCPASSTGGRNVGVAFRW
jgi:hypothetical protein